MTVVNLGVIVYAYVGDTDWL